MIGEILLPLTAAGLVIVGIATAPTTFAIFKQRRDRSPRDNFYEDRDGKSTPEAIAAFSNRWQKNLILVLSVLGFGTSIAVSVLSSIREVPRDLLLENWLITASWILVLVQAISAGALNSPLRSQEAGISVFVSCATTCIASISQLVFGHKHLTIKGSPSQILHFVNIVTAIVAALSSTLIPRRPSVSWNDSPVDAQWTVSAFNRRTWTWIEPLLKLASKKNDLNLEDVPQPDHTLRTEALIKKWNGLNLRGSLVMSVLRVYKFEIFLQYTATVIRCIIGVGPFWALLRLITALEKKPSERGPWSWEPYLLILFLGTCTVLEQWLDNWVQWYAYADMTLPLRAQLSALIFEKSLRRKNVKAADKKQKKEGPGPGDSDSKKKDDEEDEEGESSVLKSRQAIVNLVGVDTLRVTTFVAYQFHIFASILKLTIFSAFLVKVLGWMPYTIGMLVWLLTVPVNIRYSRILVKVSDELMKVRDGKLAVVNEALQGIRQIKFSALEKQWEKRILDEREKELKTVWKYFCADAFLFACWVISPIMLAAASLATYGAIHGELRPSVAFVSIGIFKALEVTLSALPEIISNALDTLVSLRRMDTYLQGPNMEDILEKGPQIAFVDAKISWPADEETPEEERFILRDLNFEFPQGELSIISGKTGTGKSLLLSAILGEVDLLKGSISVPPTVPSYQRSDSNAHPGNWIVPGSVAYVAQSPWMESASLKDNILFGLPFVEDRYNAVIAVCALKKDLQNLPEGDKTELGPNGINLSGGQKWRITLARAIYSRAEILVMDDIFSAVDAHVGRHIFEKCITGDICRGRTRIIVTHHVALVASKAKALLELGDGIILNAGLVSELGENGTLKVVESHEQSQQEIFEDESAESPTVVNSEEASIDYADNPTASEEANNLQKVSSKTGKEFIQNETREKGVVNKAVYAEYFKAGGGWSAWGLCLAIYIGFYFLILFRAWWLRVWTGGGRSGIAVANVHDAHSYASTFALQNTSSALDTDIETAGAQNNVFFYLWVYVGVSLISVCLGIFRYLWGFIISIRASRILFEKILFTVLRTPLRWIDTVPVGRILNRFTSDFNTIDNHITLDLSFLMSTLLGLICICIASFLVSPIIIPIAVALIAFGVMIGKRYLDGARPLKRLESTCKSPVFDIFNGALAGITTIRSFQKTQTYIEMMYTKLDSWDVISFYMWLGNRWMGFRMAVLGACFSTIVATALISTPGIDAALAGFALSFALDFSGTIMFLIRFYAGLELEMNSTERVVEYSKLKTENLSGEKPPAAWPSSGAMEVKDLEVSYADDLPPVLKGVSFNVKDNERIGVIGRTGAGKSSLTLALFRFLEARSGSVVIDGVDISKIDLHSLRSRLAIISQDPILFSGTLRSNLDPFNDHTDEELHDCLSQVHLVDVEPSSPGEPSSSAASTAGPTKNVNIFKDLSSPISESGGNLSQGQRQLICLARAIVSRPKIMVLDEATSAVDMDTDALIQRSIREGFTNSTLIVIAHRLSTIADFDRILVLSDGQVAEFGTPRELWETEGSIFRDMCESSGEKDRLKQTVLGENALKELASGEVTEGS